MEGLEAPPGYTVLRRLGSDASAMCLATHDASGRTVTLRFLGAVPDAVRERLVGAAPTLRSVDHVHVAPFLDVVSSQSGPVVVFGAAEGGSLAGILGARGRLPAGEVVTACAPVAEGLADVHRRGLVHGDLTLDDVVFSLDGRPMVVGVGLVQIGIPLRVGQYARPVPPEVEAGSPPGPPADVHGLTTAAMIALSGHLPSARISLPGVTPGAEALLLAGMDPNPQRRPPASNLGNAFFAIAEPAPVELVLEEDHATTTGSLPQVPASPIEPEDDVAAYMRRSTSMGRRARRRAEDAESAPEAGGPAAAAAAGAGAGAARAGDTAEAADAHDATDTSSGSGSSRRRRRSGRRDESGTAGGATGGAAGADAGSSGTGPDGSAAARDSGRRGRQRSSAGAMGADESGASPDTSAAASAAPSPGRARKARGASASGAPESSNAVRDAAPSRRGRRGTSPTGGGDENDDGRSGRRDGLWIVSAIVGVLLVGGAVLVGVQLFGDEPRTGPGTGSSPENSEASTDLCGGPQPAPDVQPAEVSDWTQEVQRLYSLRSQAFEEGKPELLCQVHAPSNPVLAEDASLIEEYNEAGVHAEGLKFEVVNAELVSQDAGTATVEITQRIPDYELVSDEGEVEQEMAGTEDLTWQADLVAVAENSGETASWRFG